jgi:mRNA interferase MazF
MNINQSVKQGDIYWINFSPAIGSELKGKHPGVIIQSSDINQSLISTVVVIGISSNLKLKDVNGNVFLKKGTGGLSKDSVVNISQVHTIDKSRLRKKMGRLSKTQVEYIFFGLDLLFDR